MTCTTLIKTFKNCTWWENELAGGAQTNIQDMDYISGKKLEGCGY